MVDQNRRTTTIHVKEETLRRAKLLAFEDRKSVSLLFEDLVNKEYDKREQIEGAK